ncbi:helix-turn-helix domain-containing protein [Streptomyces sp. NPDC051563]|uniref:helix-turn-helix domain-containing protein n=1 Tax=Streptomyces sp. NPDC051563 TaxID=3365659 RepID=UPI0037B730AC
MTDGEFFNAVALKQITPAPVLSTSPPRRQLILHYRSWRPPRCACWHHEVPHNAPHPRLQAFGFAVRDARERSGMSIEALAEAADLSARMVIGIEHGKRNPSLLTVLALAHGLGVSPGRLLEFAAARQEPEV